MTAVFTLRVVDMCASRARPSRLKLVSANRAFFVLEDTLSGIRLGGNV